MNVSKKRKIIRKRFLKKIFKIISICMISAGFIVLMGAAGASDLYGVDYPDALLIKNGVIGLLLMFGGLIIQ